MAKKTATLTDNETGKSYEFPIIHGTVGPRLVDIRKMYGESGMFTYDPGFTSTGSCGSKITYIDGDEGVLLYRGYNIAELAEQSDHMEVSYLLMNGELPNKVVPKTRMKFDAFYLPHRNSYLVYEYRREAGNVCQAVLTRKQEGGVEYRFVGAPYRPEDYLVETEQGPLALDYTQWASGLRRSGTPVSPKLGATSEFRSVISQRVVIEKLLPIPR